MERVKTNPAKVILTSYVTLILISSLLFWVAPTTKDEISYIDALFTVTSAVTVTGLTVLSTGSDLTPLGEAFVLLLIQVGGLGYMTLTTFFFVLLGRRIGLRERLILSESLSYPGVYGLVRFLKRTVVFTLTVELAGFFLLLLRWLGDMDLSKALYFSLFHSVSAFNNAGFSLFPESLGPYRNDPYTVLVFSLLIVLGGIGFFVVQDILFFIRGRVKRLSTHTKVVLTSTLLLILGGWLLLMLTELGHPGGVWEKGVLEGMLSTFFLSVSSRTAGFTTVDLSDLSESSLFFLLTLMFIGASPGGTGGGVKTVTFALITVAVLSYIRGREEIVLFGRSVSRDQVYRAMVVILLSTAYIVTANLVLDRIEERDFLSTLFEVVSAFSTVGLSVGSGGLSFSSGFSPVGKLVIIVTMVVGRVGILSFAFAIAMREKRASIRHPEARLLI